MSRMIVLDQKACTGCRQCELVCSVKHTGTANPSRARIRVIRWDVDGFYLPMFCQQCVDPPCGTVCPKSAISRDGENGLVTIDRDRCIGCRMCIMACPFGVLGFDADGGGVVKCDLCGGDPLCVLSCEAGALSFIEAEAAERNRMRAFGERVRASAGQARAQRSEEP